MKLKLSKEWLWNKNKPKILKKKLEWQEKDIILIMVQYCVGDEVTM